MPAVVRSFPTPSSKLLWLVAGCRRQLPLLQNFDELIRVADGPARDRVGSLVPGAQKPLGHPNREVFALGQTHTVRVIPFSRKCGSARIGFHLNQAIASPFLLI